MRLQQREQAPAHDHAGPVGGHVHFDLAAHVDDGVGIGALEHLPVLGDDRRVPVDQLLGGALGFRIVAEQDLHDLDLAIGDRRRAVEDDVPQAGRIFHVETPAERHEPTVAHVPRGGRRGGPRDAGRVRRVADRHDRLGLETVIGLDDLVLLGLGLVDVTERALVHEGKVRVVERVLHQPQRGRGPGIVELVDAAVFRIAILGHVGNLAEWLIEGHPHVAIARVGAEGTGARIGHRLLERELRDVHELAVAIVLPAVVAAHDVAVAAPALGKLGRPVAAAVFERRGLALRVEEQHDLLVEQREWGRPRREPRQRHGRIPEAPQNLLLGIEHRRHSFARRREPTGLQVSCAISLSCQPPRTSRDSPTMARNSATPASAMSSSAANMRGISSWKPA